MGICLPFVMYAIQAKGRDKMAEIKRYTKKDGTTAYKFNAYLGVNPKTGKKKRTTRQGFATKKEAKLALARLEIGDDKPKSKDSSLNRKYITFEEVYKAWFAQYKNTVKRITSVNTERFFNNRILPKFGHLLITNITPEYCQEVINKWSEQYTNYRVMKGYVSSVINYAIMRRLIKDDPFRVVVIPRKKAEVVDESILFFNKEELREFLSFIKAHRSYYDFAMFRLLAYSGMRKSELMALTWSDINFFNNTVRINKSLAEYDGGVHVTTPKTKNSIRKLMMDKVTMDILKKRKSEQKERLLSKGIIIKNDDEQLLFPNKFNEPRYLDYPNYVMEKYTKKQLSPHGLRHTHASLLFEAGATIKEVQMRLGHSSVKTTMDIYTHVMQTPTGGPSDKFAMYMEA